jgi:hypothetical protein
MRLQQKHPVPKLLQLGKSIALFSIGGMLIHTLTMLFDYFLVPEPFYFDLRTDSLNVIFSTFMIPMVGVYGLSILTIYFLWEKKKNALHFAFKKEVENEKVEAVLKSLQHLTAMLAQNIAAYNAEIMNQVECRKRQGQPISEKVEAASIKIGYALKSLSELSFVLPYTTSRPEQVEDIEKILKNKLAEVNPHYEEKDKTLKKQQTAAANLENSIIKN